MGDRAEGSGVDYPGAMKHWFGLSSRGCWCSSCREVGLLLHFAVCSTGTWGLWLSQVATKPFKSQKPRQWLWNCRQYKAIWKYLLLKTTNKLILIISILRYFYLYDAYLLPEVLLFLVEPLLRSNPIAGSCGFDPQVKAGQWWWAGAWPCGGLGMGMAEVTGSKAVSNPGMQNGGRPALGTCTAAKCGCPDGSVGSPMAGVVKGLFGAGGGEAVDGAGAACWMPLGLWLQCCFGGGSTDTVHLGGCVSPWLSWCGARGCRCLGVILLLHSCYCQLSWAWGRCLLGWSSFLLMPTGDAAGACSLSPAICRHRESAETHTWQKLGTGGFFELSFTLEEGLFFNALKAELIIELFKRRLPITRQMKTRLFCDLEWLQDLLPVQFSVQFVADVASFQKYWSHAVENTGHILKHCFLVQQEFR